MFALFFALMTLASSVQPVDFRTGLTSIEAAWETRFELDKQEDQLILSNMQIASALSRMTVLANNLKAQANPDDTTKAILKSTLEIIERYEGYYRQNELNLNEIYSKRKKYVTEESFRRELSEWTSCADWRIPTGASIRMRLEKLYPSDRQKFSNDLSLDSNLVFDHWITISIHDGENNFSLPETRQAHVLLGLDGKAKILLVPDASGNCRKAL
jgi:hypothetical protein